MNWIDIASIIFVCVTMNHLGLIKAVEDLVGRFPIINCPKCVTMWSVLAYGLWSVGFSDLPFVLAISFLSSYCALWLELIEGYIDTLYLKMYDKIFRTQDNALASDPDEDYSASTLP